MLEGCTYKATYGEFGSCANNVEIAPITGCARSDGKPAETSSCSPQEQTRPCYVGTWVKDTKLFTTTCSGNKREQYYPVSCVKPDGTKDQNACDPATRPSNDSTTQACSATCNPPRKGFFYSPQKGLGTVTGTTIDEKIEAGRLLCETYRSTTTINSFHCTVLPSASGNTANVYVTDASQATFIASNGYYTGLCYVR